MARKYDTEAVRREYCLASDAVRSWDLVARWRPLTGEELAQQQAEAERARTLADRYRRLLAQETERASA